MVAVGLPWKAARMTVRIDDLEDIRLITIDRPDRSNAIDPATSAALGRALSDAAHDESVRVVVLTGAGDRSFCAGMDLRAFRDPAAVAPPPGAGVDVLTERHYPKPVIGAVNGAAVGGGLGLALACDLLVAADHATFGIPEVQRGLVGVGVTSRIARRVPPAAALELALTGEPISAERARDLGFVNQVVPAAELLGATLALARRIAANAPLAVQAAKSIVEEVCGLHDAAALESLRARAEHVIRSDDAREGTTAFLERRPPVFRGR
jgi:enoyl-CoA hydratase